MIAILSRTTKLVHPAAAPPVTRRTVVRHEVSPV